MNNKTGNIHFYQSANQNFDEIKQHFVVRNDEYHRIITEIKRDKMNGSIQHFLLIGRRGSGKSSLLRRIQAEVITDNTLSKRLIVINLSEEQAGVYRLHDLWILILKELRENDNEIVEPDWMMFSNMTEYSKCLYRLIQEKLKAENKKLLLLLDNIDRIFDNIGDEAHLLRELLTNYKDLRIIGCSTRLSEHYWKYELPFYQFFRVVRLNSLSDIEVKNLLQHWSTFLELPEIESYIKSNPGSIQAIRMLTDGMPRTILNFIEILINQPEQNGFEHLRYIVDRATPIYQERLANLPPAQQKIVLELSFFWDAIGVKQLSEACKMPGKVVSAQLSQLEKTGTIEKIKSKKKDMLYRLSERFFNLWLMMTQGGTKEKRQIRYLTVFLESWYDNNGLQMLYSNKNNINKGVQRKDYSVITAKAFAQRKDYIVAQSDDLITQTHDIAKEITRQQDSSKSYKKAFENFYFPLQFLEKSNYDEMENYYRKAVDKGDIDAMNNLVMLYYKLNENKTEASELMGKVLDKRTEIETQSWHLILLLWSGRFDDFTIRNEKLISELIQAKEIDLLYFIFTSLLAHQQTNFAWNWFSNVEHGENLKGMIKPLYYVTASLIRSEKTFEEGLKAGPEIKETILEISEFIIEQQKFYYG